MKIERLIGIVFYLINRKLVSANQLADYFDVSKRTILRDINVLTLAGIPIYSESGPKGGYSINPSFQVNSKILDSSNTQYMLLALKSLKSVYGENKVNETYEKVKHIYKSDVEDSHIQIDFSVIKENESVINKVSSLRTAKIENRTICFNYTNQNSLKRFVKGNVIHVYYKWYAWYAFIHDLKKNQYLMFKIIRMDSLEITNELYTDDYNVDRLLNEYIKTNENQRIELLIEYSTENETLVREYFQGALIENDHSVVRRKIFIKENDFMMFSLILGFGDKIKVISPISYRERVAKHLKKSLDKNYLIGDI